MSEGLKPRRARGSAFAADRTDLDDVTPPPPAPPLSGLMPKIAPELAVTLTKAKGASSEPGERARGVGGRPPRVEAEGQLPPARALTKRPARIPADLYAAAEPLVKGPGRPSWGQLVLWACTSEREAVLEHVVQQLAPDPDPLAPRGANRAGGVTTPIIPQFLGSEIEPVDEIQAAAQDQVEGLGPRPVKVTATAVVIAALKVAVEKSSE